MDIGSIFILLSMIVVVGMILSQPFQSRPRTSQDEVLAEDSVASQRSALMANRDQVLDALQELDFDHTLGKIPEEAYQSQRVVLLRHGTQVLRQLDEIDSTVQPQEDAESRLENAIASRRADGRQVVTRPGDEDLEDLLAARRRARQVKSAGFCPKCGKPAQTTDQFCSRCGSNLEESA